MYVGLKLSLCMAFQYCHYHHMLRFAYEMIAADGVHTSLTSGT